ncbi:hypothetical protein [Streptacidiphilus anmyonensis]|uniref:hypothetical protein n=1 Tax=Streptacidiphilus anmyonensis TaxID=405782 RepID=UPI00128BCCDC|nr:hypothetical protein [Streptacidiphilus anmyonensis]
MASDNAQPRGSRSGSGRRELHIRGGIQGGGRRDFGRGRGRGRGQGRGPGRGRRIVIGAGLVAAAPLWLLIGYPLERTWGRPTSRSRLGFDVTRHPVAIALTAPMRFVSDRVRGGRARRPGLDSGPDLSGDRFPRRPKPAPPGDSIALGEPRG